MHYFSAFSEKFGDICDEYNDRFADFDLLKTQVELFNNPLEVDRVSTTIPSARIV